MRFRTLAFLSILIAFALISPPVTKADDAPDLTTSEDWLVSVLPKEQSGTTFLGGVEDRYEYSYSGCVLTVWRGEWMEPWSEPQSAPSPLQLPMVEVAFEARAGLTFDDQAMNHDERYKMKTTYPDATGNFSGRVSNIDLSLVRSDSFKIESGWTSDITIIQEVVTHEGQRVNFAFDDPDLASRVATAIQHISQLCGAHNDPF